MQLTPDQIQNLASDTTKNVYVSASAGTGKTKILTDRFVRFAQSSVPMQNILCLTFTNAAAHEMKHRIGSKLKEISSELYQEFIVNYNNLQIKTIHSLCSDVLAKADIAFSSKKLLDSNVKSKLLNRIIHDVYTEIDTASPYIIEHLAKYFDEYDLFVKLSSLLSKKTNNFMDVENVDEYYRKLFGIEDISLKDIHKKIFDEIPEYLFGHFEKFSEFKDVNEIIEKQDVKKYLLCFYTQKGEFRKVFYKKNPEAAECFEREGHRVSELYDLYKTVDNCLTHSYLITFFQLCALRFYEYKAAHDFYEFDDLITESIQLLSESDTALNILYKLDMQIDHILVDEAQDLSPLQWELIKIVTDEFFAGDSARELDRTIFIVGDFKQSIYSFQGADPTSFLEAKTYFAQKLRNCGKELLEVEMHHSFRSAQNILLATDSVFANPERSFAVTGQHNSVISHIATRDAIGRVEILELSENSRRESIEGWDIPSESLDYYNPKQQTAIKIAALAKSWVDSGCEQSDILILIRKRSELVNFLIKELKNNGLQVSDSSQNSLSNELIVRDFISVAKYILFPYDDLNVASLLKSPFVGISEDELFKLCYNRTEHLYKKVQLDFNFAGDVKNFYINLLEKYKPQFIKRFGQKAINIINDFLRYLLAKDGSFSLVDLVNEVENYSINTSDNKKLVKGKINILTVHAAKGLQAKKVILADSASTEQHPNADILIYEGNIFFNLTLDYNCKFINNIKEKIRDVSDLESMRLLYVAMTRAEDELYITGWDNNRIKGSWYEVVKESIADLEVATSIQKTDVSLQPKEVDVEVPEYITQPITDAISVGSFTPSQSFHSNTAAIKRGIYIHQLLMKLGNSSNHAKILGQISEPDILEKAQLILDKQPNLFNSKTLNEVPIAGIVDGKYIFGQIDKLVINDDLVEIIDIKTDENPPESCDKINHAYIRQLGLYRQLIAKIHPSKKISCAILWFNNQVLMQVG